MRAYAARLRRRRGAVGRHRPAARPRLRALSRTCDDAATRARSLRDLERAATSTAGDGPRRSPRTPTSSASRATATMEKTLFAVDELSRLHRRLRLRAARGHPRHDAQVGQEEAQAAELRRGRQPRRGPRRAPRSSASTSTSTSRFVIAALEERADELELHGSGRARPRVSARGVATAPSCARRTSAAVRRRRSSPACRSAMDALAIVLFVRDTHRLLRRRGRRGRRRQRLGAGDRDAGHRPAHRPARPAAACCCRSRSCTRSASRLLVGLGARRRAARRCSSSPASSSASASRRWATVMRHAAAAAPARRASRTSSRRLRARRRARRDRLRRRAAAHRGGHRRCCRPPAALGALGRARRSAGRSASRPSQASRAGVDARRRRPRGTRSARCVAPGVRTLVAGDDPVRLRLRRDGGRRCPPSARRRGQPRARPACCSPLWSLAARPARSCTARTAEPPLRRRSSSRLALIMPLGFLPALAAELGRRRWRSLILPAGIAHRAAADGGQPAHRRGRAARA